MSVFSRERALALLRLGAGQSTADFREGQEQAISHLVEGKGRLLVVQKTGWGKSFVYFIATKMLREEGLGPALLVSPLLALMRNQIEAAKKMGVRAETIHSDNQNDWPQVEAQIDQDEVDILLISPERLANPHFQTHVLTKIANRVSLLIVDEAHCVSDWGHDFRPHYRFIERIVRTLPPNIRVLATTATANKRVMEDLQTILGPQLETMWGELSRPSLTLQTITLSTPIERLAWLAERMETLQGHGIVYTLTVRDARMVANWLKHQGFSVESYTSEDGGKRVALEQALQNNQIKALVATTALGMGYDKPDLAFVIHYQLPGSVVAYYQQVGRAGRALETAYGILLSGKEETSIQDWFIHNAFPTKQEVSQLLGALEKAPNGLSVPELLQRINVSAGRIGKAIQLLSLESPAPIVKEGKKWQLTAATLQESFWDRAERLTHLRKQEQKQMETYVRLSFGQHMGFLLSALDGDPNDASPPKLPPLPESVSPEYLQKAHDFVKRTPSEIEPRKMWPSGGMQRYGVKGVIPIALQAQPGKVLCGWGDGGWGDNVREGKYLHNRFSDDLVIACQELLRVWCPQPAPRWVACVPSQRHPNLVPDFAQRLAHALKLPFHNVLTQAEDRPEQKSMQNSAQQARNLDGTLVCREGSLVLPEPVLLIDDMVDSRWTLTVCAWLLRQRGCGEVWPLALAQTGYDP